MTKKQIKVEPTTILNFWHENKIVNHYTLTVEEFKTKFFEWCKTKSLAWLANYGCMTAINVFIGEKEGLNSVGDGDMNKGELLIAYKYCVEEFYKKMDFLSF